MGMTMTQKILAAHAGLPSVEAGQLIEADLDLVLGNDITSPVAIHEMDKFTKEGTITLKLELDTAGNVAVFSVTDTGCGIPLDKQKRVFERFEKLNEYVQGTGLGLSICKLTVEKWGGEIWIDPAYTDGARFMFTHPMNL